MKDACFRYGNNYVQEGVGSAGVDGERGTAAKCHYGRACCDWRVFVMPVARRSQGHERLNGGLK